MRRLLFLTSYLLFFLTSLYAQGQYEYWIDGNLAERQQGTYDGKMFTTLLDLSSYSEGVHQLNFRFADKEGLWSSPVNVYILQRKHLTNNNVGTFVYWLDDDVENRKKVETTDGTLLLDIDAKALSLGVHSLRAYASDKFGNNSCPMTSVFINKGKYFADNKIQAMEYWVNGNINSRQSVRLDTDTPILNLERSILLEGVDHDNPNTLYYRFKDINGKWSSLQSAIFTLNKKYTGIGSNFLPESFKIVNRKIYLEKQKGATVVVYNLSGNVVFSQSNIANQVVVSLLQSGVYIIKIKDAYKRTSIKRVLVL